MADIYFKRTQIIDGEYWQLVRIRNVEPGKRSSLSLTAQEYQAVSGDIGSGPKMVEKALANLRNDMQADGHRLHFEESAAAALASLILDTSSEEIDRAAAKAETPSDAEKESGNYTKGHVQLHGFDISIENAKNSERSGTDADGKRWTIKCPAHYGYIKGTKGKDKDHLDVYIGEEPDSDSVFVVNQGTDDGTFDEHKIMLGFGSQKSAVETYDAAFNDDLGPKLRMSVVSTTIDGLKDWIKDGDTKKPFKESDKTESHELAEALLEADSPKEFVRKTVSLPEPSDCGQNCYICGNPCTRVHGHKSYRELATGTVEHICNRCDVRRFSDMLDQL